MKWLHEFSFGRLDASIAIVGGADGPTSIYVASRVSPWALGGLLAAGIGLVLYCLWRHR